MGKFVTDATSERIESVMFAGWGNSPRENFLKEELRRYVPQQIGKPDEEIALFAARQRAIYIDGTQPTVGIPIASLNPTFKDSIDSIEFYHPRGRIVTYASVKANGYRMQLHHGFAETKAFTRQFTPYDLRMFPELAASIKQLPLMIGDAELVNLRHRHLAGFNRVQKRFPNLSLWPKRGEEKVDDAVLEEYLADPEIFEDGKPHEDLELGLVFHGMYMIANPGDWQYPLENQIDGRISLCQLPIDYISRNYLLHVLQEWIAEKGIKNVKVIERRQIDDERQLKSYIEEKERQGEEGVVINQSIWVNAGLPIELPVVAPHSVKIKKYETLDAALLGLYLKSGKSLEPENLSGALLGFFDPAVGEYLPAMRINLDPYGPQIKTDGQRSRLIDLRNEIVQMIPGLIDPDGKVITLYETFLKEGAIILRALIGKNEIDLENVMMSLPRGNDLISLLELYQSDPEPFLRAVKKPKADVAFIKKHLALFEALSKLDKRQKRRFTEYFSRVREIKAVSAKLVKPQIVMKTEQPIILQAQVFDAKWGLCPYAAGFHSWYGNSFMLTNCFAEIVRHDKSETTDGRTIHELCRRFTVKSKKPKKSK